MVRTVIWQTAPDATEFEREFIESVLLSELPDKQIRYDGTFSTPANDAIVIVSQNAPFVRPNMLQYFSRSKGHALIHLSGEWLHPTRDLYQNANCVLRSYYDPRIQSPRVFTIPLGFKSGFLSNEAALPVDKARDLAWFFAGGVKHHRAQMLSCLRQLTPFHTHLTKGFNSPGGLSVPEMQSFFRRSVFAPCPFGWINPDSFRIMEALENGSIPVVHEFQGRDYFKYVYGDHPFVVAKSWRDAAKKMQEIMLDPSELKERQSHLKIWYSDFKSRLAQDAKAILEGRFGELQSEQFRYQEEGRHDEQWKEAFHQHFRWRLQYPTHIPLIARLMAWMS